MTARIRFVKYASLIVKIVAWIILLLGISVGSLIVSGAEHPPAQSAGNSRWLGFVVWAVYLFVFIFFYLVAKTADLVVQLFKETNKE